jgi:Protein of unknown function (DUF3485)
MKGIYMAINKNILIMIGVLSMSYVMILLLASKDITNYTIVDTEYWGETENRLLIKTVYDYSDQDSIKSFPKTIEEWKGSDYRYPDFVYTKLDANILMSRKYKKNNESVIWMDIINSDTGESFHKQRICVSGAGWSVDNESIVEFEIADSLKTFSKLYANKLEISKGDKKQIMVYWFMFKKFGSGNSVTMIRLSTPVKNNSTSLTFDTMKDFVENKLFNAMYKNIEQERTTSAEYIVDKYGNMGKFVIAMALLIPICIVVIGTRKME